MKKSIIFLGVLGFTMAYAQQDTNGKVGVNTDAPTETLDVKGTAKIQELPESGVGKVYNGTAAKNTTFTGTRTLVADANGVLGFVDGLPGAGSSGSSLAYTAGQGISISDANVISRTGLEEVTQDGKTGWRLIGESANHTNIGTKAMDISRPFGSFSSGASGDYATSLGTGTVASGNYSTAIGVRTTASGPNSTVIGHMSEAIGDRALSIGNEAKANGQRAVSIGYRTQANGERTVAIGYMAKTTALKAVSIGDNAEASGESSIALGQSTVASGEGSTTMGGGSIKSIRTRFHIYRV